MNRRSFLAALATLPLVGWLFPRPQLKLTGTTTGRYSSAHPNLSALPRAEIVTDGSQSFSTSCFIGHDRAVPGSDRTFIIISGTDIHGNFITETIELPPEGFSAVGKNAYKELYLPADADDSDCTFSVGVEEKEA